MIREEEPVPLLHAAPLMWCAVPTYKFIPKAVWDALRPPSCGFSFTSQHHHIGPATNRHSQVPALNLDRERNPDEWNVHYESANHGDGRFFTENPKQRE
jgi:hypothetical protein